MKLKTVIKNLIKEHEKFVKKNGFEPVVWDIEIDNYEGEMFIELVKGKRKKRNGVHATSYTESIKVKFSN